MTAPLTPAGCDLRDFQFMPLQVERLKKSKAWLYAKRRPELGFYMINLWAASWHEVPAASLEDDDDVLADAAMCDLKRWPQVKEKVLHGWVKCSDGRLYHPVVAEKAIEAWEAKKKQRGRTAKATEARKNVTGNDKAPNDKRDDDRNERRNDNRNVARNDDRDDDVTSTKGQGRDSRQGREKEEIPEAAEPYDPLARLDVLCRLLRKSPATHAGIIQKWPNELNALMAEGLDFDRHILPCVKDASARKVDVKSMFYFRPKALELKSVEGLKAVTDQREAHKWRMEFLANYTLSVPDDSVGKLEGETGKSGWRWAKNTTGNGVWKDACGVGPPPHDPGTLVTEEELARYPAAKAKRDELRARGAS